MGLRGPGLHKPSRGHLPTRKAVVEWLARATSRCRPFTDSGPGGRLPRVRLLPRSLLLQRSNPTESTTHGGEGLPQTTPLLSAWGRKWGPTPQGSMNTSSQRSLMHCSRKPCETHPRGEVRVAAAMPEGHCGGFGTSSRMRCGMLKRLGTRQRRPDIQGHRQPGSHSKSTTAIFSAPTGRLGCRRGSTRAPGERRPTAGRPTKSSPRGRAAGNY
jgi:hypothetical protein